MTFDGFKLAEILEKKSVTDEEIQYVIDNLCPIIDFLSKRGCTDLSYRYWLYLNEFGEYKRARIQNNKWTLA